jgi:uncharacterized membrane protein
MARRIDRGSEARGADGPLINCRAGCADVLLAVVLVRAAQGGGQAAMGHVRDSFYVDAPPDAVWSVAADARRIPEWNATVVDVKDVSGPLDAPGARYTTVSKIAGRPLEITWTVERAERPRHAEASASTPIGGSAHQVVQYLPEGRGTRVNVDVDYEIAPGLLGQVVSKAFADRSIERDVRYSGVNFRALVEELTARVPVGSGRR